MALAWRAGRALLLLYAMSAVAGALLPVGAAWLTKAILDALTDGGAVSWHSTIVPAVGLAVIGAATPVLSHATRYLSAELERATGLVAQERLYDAVNRFVGLGRFENPAFLDRLRMAQQSGQMTPGQAVDSALGIVRGLLTSVGFLVSLAVLSWPLMLAVLLAALPALFADLALARRSADVLWAISPAERREQFYSSLLSDVRAAKEIRLLGLGTFFRERMSAERRSANAAKRQQDRRELAVHSGLSLLSGAVAGAGLIWAVRAASQGALTVGDISVLLAAIVAVQNGLGQLVADGARMHQHLLLFGHFQAVVAAAPDLPLTTNGHAVSSLHRGIELRDVWFRYAKDQPWVLRGVSFTIPFGKSVGLVGHNGAGKSTIAKLILRYYDPTSGAVLWDGMDIRDLPIDELRRRVGAVFQDYMEYDLTASENIGVGDLDVLDDDARIRSAAELAGIHDILVALPHGYETLLSRVFTSEADRDDPSTGVVLSGGQWQRLALARAMLRVDRDLTILDEPSSGLDPQAEYEIHRMLREKREGRASLLISHRLAAVREVDLIIVLDHGEVVERGGHADLMSARGLYCDLFTLQASGYAEARAETEDVGG